MEIEQVQFQTPDEDIQTERQIDIDTERKTETEKQRERDSHRQTERETDWVTERQTDILTTFLFWPTFQTQYQKSGTRICQTIKTKIFEINFSITVQNVNEGSQLV